MRKIANIFFLAGVCLLVYNLLNFFVMPENIQTVIISDRRRKLVSVEVDRLRATPKQETAENITNEEVPTTESNHIKEEESDILHKIYKLTECVDKPLKRRVEQRGDYYVLYNYVVAERSFRCFESVTYATQGDLNFLDNLIPLVERWMGPVSVSVYAPGTDFLLALQSIQYLRYCRSPLIKEYVTFHLFFDTKYTPKAFRAPLLYDDKRLNYFSCKMRPSYETASLDKQFKTKNNLTYPINVARNTARLAAQTHFILSSDVELYPSPNFIPKFLEMIAKNEELVKANERQVFVIPHFEVVEGSEVPMDKTTLVEMVRNESAFFFHEHLCRTCHMIPNYSKWLLTPESDSFHIFEKTKRTGAQKSWEPFYVGTNNEPFFDERLSWEGQKNKMTQNYILCVLDYIYLILDNAFLVHRPGIKKEKVQMNKYVELVDKTTKLVRKTIKPEIDSLYGRRMGCQLK